MTRVIPRTPLVRYALLLVGLVLISATSYLFIGAPRDASPPGDDLVTFNRDIAPIVYRNCVVCHRPGESAPFSFLDYREAKKRAGLIAALTSARFMPPWLPERGEVEFLGERGLSEAEIALIRRWVEQGAVEGDPADRPAPPSFTEGWQLGEPDLEITMDTPFTVPARANATLFRQTLRLKSIGRSAPVRLSKASTMLLTACRSRKSKL